MHLIIKISVSSGKWLVLFVLLLAGVVGSAAAQRGGFGGGRGFGGSGRGFGGGWPDAEQYGRLTKSPAEQFLESLHHVMQEAEGEPLYDAEAGRVGSSRPQEVAYLKIYGYGLGDTGKRNAILVTDYALISAFLHSLTRVQVGDADNNKDRGFEVHFLRHNGIEPSPYFHSFSRYRAGNDVSERFEEALVRLGNYQQARLRKQILPHAAQISAITIDHNVVKPADVPPFVRALLRADGRLFSYDGATHFHTLRLGVRGGEPMEATIGISRNSYWLTKYYPHAPPVAATILKYCD